MLQQTSTKKCPGCSGESPLEAARCEYCGRWFTPKENDAAREQVAAETQSKAPSSGSVESVAPAASPARQQATSHGKPNFQLQSDEEEKIRKKKTQSGWIIVLVILAPLILCGYITSSSNGGAKLEIEQTLESQYQTMLTLRFSHLRKIACRT